MFVPVVYFDNHFGESAMPSPWPCVSNQAPCAPIEQTRVQGHLIVGSFPGNLDSFWANYAALNVSIPYFAITGMGYI
jgi:hypothetical protein